MARSKTPDQMKVMKGTDKKYRLSGAHTALAVISKVPPAPSWFTPLARTIYRDVTKELMAKTLLQVVGLPLIVAYCAAIATHLQLEEEMSTEGRFITVESKAGSYEAISPKHKASYEALEKSRQIAVEYGFTIISQQRIINQATKKDGNDKFFD